MEWLKTYWVQLTVLVGLLTGGGAWVATADTYHKKTEENSAIGTRAVQAVERLETRNELEAITIRILCNDPSKAEDVTCLAIAAQDKAREARAKARAEAAKTEQ